MQTNNPQFCVSCKRFLCLSIFFFASTPVAEYSPRLLNKVNAIANSGKPDAVERAESVVRKVEELDFVRPNTVLYNSLINTIVKSEMPDSSERAERVLKRMDEVRRAGNSDVSPDSFAYRYVVFKASLSTKLDTSNSSYCMQIHVAWY